MAGGGSAVEPPRDGAWGWELLLSQDSSVRNLLLPPNRTPLQSEAGGSPNESRRGRAAPPELVALGGAPCEPLLPGWRRDCRGRRRLGQEAEEFRVVPLPWTLESFSRLNVQ